MQNNSNLAELKIFHALILGQPPRAPNVLIILKYITSFQQEAESEYWWSTMKRQ